MDKTHPFHPDPPRPPAEAPSPLGAELSDEAHPEQGEARGLLRAMLSSRRLEERIVELYRQGEITGGCYTGIGNEATSVGTAWAMAASDILVPTHRDMGSHLVRGHTPLEIMRQYLKRGTAQTGGKDSGLHLGKEGTEIVGMISHLAHMMPVAAGIALAERQAGRKTVVLTTVGDGATSLGDFHEALNFAAVQKLAVVFVIVNNQYAYSTPVTIQYACERLSDRAKGYGIAGEQVDGSDVVTVCDAARRAFERGRRGEGPTLLECVTMRMRGHSEHDDFKYVPEALLDRWRAWDPVERLTRYGLGRGYWQESDVQALRDEVSIEIETAIETAKSDPEPRPETAGQDVFRRWSPEWTVPTGDRWELEP